MRVRARAVASGYFGFKVIEYVPVTGGVDQVAALWDLARGATLGFVLY
jgi:hypothetical protein